MGLSENYFGKPLDRLEFTADLEPFILKEIPESQNLEYKSGGPLSEHGDIVSAFLNSGGGLLIIGAPTEIELSLPNGRTAKVCRGPFKPLPPISKDDARRSLISKVSPLPAGVLVNPLLCPGGCVIVVEVEPSSYPPHQHDGGYWIRLDGETRRAPHAFVEALFLQRRGPNLECDIVTTRARAVDSNDSLDRWELEFQLTVRNNSPNIAEYVAFDLKVDRSLSPKQDGFIPCDPQPVDFLITTVRDTKGRTLFRFRLRSDVLHAYEWKTFHGAFDITRSYDEGTRIQIIVELQAKDMLRKRYEYEPDINMIRREQKIEPIRALTIGARESQEGGP